MAKRFKGGLHGRKVIYHFKQPAMDFFFQWIVGASTNGASTVGECFSTAARIKDGDPQSWAFHWNELAKKVQQRAEMSLRNGKIISALEAFFRAAVYYRSCTTFLNPLQEKNIFTVYKGLAQLFPKSRFSSGSSLSSVLDSLSKRLSAGILFQTC